MANFINRTKKKFIVRDLDPDTDLLKVFQYTQAHQKSFFLDSAAGFATGLPLSFRSLLYQRRRYIRDYVLICLIR